MAGNNMERGIVELHPTRLVIPRYQKPDRNQTPCRFISSGFAPEPKYKAAWGFHNFHNKHQISQTLAPGMPNASTNRLRRLFISAKSA